MRSFVHLCALAVLASAAVRPAWAADSYVVDIAFDASFDTEGKVTELRPHNEAEHPAALWSNLKSRLGGMKLPPVKTEDGQPATFRTGLYLNLEVSQEEGKAGQVRIKGLSAKPLVLAKDYWGLPDLVSRQGHGVWAGEVEAECIVGVDGKCGEVKVKAVASMPKAVLLWASSSMALWRFQPPEINGKPIAAPVHEVLKLQASDNMPVDFRDQTNRPQRPEVGQAVTGRGVAAGLAAPARQLGFSAPA